MTEQNVTVKGRVVKPYEVLSEHPPHSLGWVAAAEDGTYLCTDGTFRTRSGGAWTSAEACAKFITQHADRENVSEPATAEICRCVVLRGLREVRIVIRGDRYAVESRESEDGEWKPEYAPESAGAENINTLIKALRDH